MSYNSYENLYKIEEISFIGGSTVLLDFEISSSSDQPFDITNHYFRFRLSPYGTKNYAILELDEPIFVNSNTVRFILQEEYTANLYGKYIQELYSSGDELVYGDYSPIKVIELLESAQTGISPDTDITFPSTLYVKGSNLNASGDVVITGLDVLASELIETLALNGTQEVLSQEAFTTITSINFPARIEEGDSVEVGIKGQLIQDYSEIKQGIVTIHRKLG